MTPQEAVRLLAHAAAFDNRQPSEAAATAWAAALHDMPADEDALAAIARFYGTPPARPGERLWIQPHDVRTHRSALLSERLSGFQYEPIPGDENPRVYLAETRRQRAAVAAGHRPAATHRPALTAGATDFDDLAKSIGQTIPRDDRPQRRGPMGVQCPICAARIGQPCRGHRGTRRGVHAQRKRTADGQPTTGPTPDQVCAAATAHFQHAEETP